MRKITNPLLRFSYWLFRVSTKYLGSPEYQNKMGFCAFNWLTPFVERYGYDWTLTYRLDKTISHSNKPKSPGRIVKTKSRAEYEPTISTDGGRVVRTIPKGLKKIKEAQNG